MGRGVTARRTPWTDVSQRLPSSCNNGQQQFSFCTLSRIPTGGRGLAGAGGLGGVASGGGRGGVGGRGACFRAQQGRCLQGSRELRFMCVSERSRLQVVGSTARIEFPAVTHADCGDAIMGAATRPTRRL